MFTCGLHVCDCSDVRHPRVSACAADERFHRPTQLRVEIRAEIAASITLARIHVDCYCYNKQYTNKKQ